MGVPESTKSNLVWSHLRGEWQEMRVREVVVTSRRIFAHVMLVLTFSPVWGAMTVTNFDLR